MRKSVFEFRDYKAYLKAYMAQLPTRGHGFRAEIAKALNVHSAYVTQVLNSGAHFSLEQAEDLNFLLGHNTEEGAYFLLLTQLARAGTQRLKKRVLSQMDAALEKRADLKPRVKISKELTAEEQLIYYSSWHYTAIHIALTIPQYQSVEALSEALNLPREKVRTVVDYLMSCGLIEEKGSRLQPTTHLIYIGRDSTAVLNHHTNWRIRAIESLDANLQEDLHFSAALSLSVEDYSIFREELAQVIQNTIERVKASKEETLCALNLDFFKLVK